MQKPLESEVAYETLALFARHKNQHEAAKEAGVSRSTFQSRLVRAKQILDSSVVMSVLHERKFAELEINHGTVLVCSDVHAWPGDMTTAQRAFIWFVEALQPAAVVINGDLFDGTGLSRFPSSNWNQKPSVRQELDACQRFTSAIERVAGGAKRIFVPGNHDDRFNRKLVAEVPEFAGVQGFNLYDLFPAWTMAYRLTINPDSNGMTDIVHNYAGGVHAAYNNVLRSGVSYVTGHTHRNLVRPWADRSGLRWGIETGTLAGETHPSSYYIAGRPVDWHPGFVLLTYRNGLLLRPEQIDVHGENEVSFRGTVAEPPQYD